MITTSTAGCLFVPFVCAHPYVPLRLRQCTQNKQRLRRQSLLHTAIEAPFDACVFLCGWQLLSKKLCRIHTHTHTHPPLCVLENETPACLYTLGQLNLSRSIHFSYIGEGGWTTRIWKWAGESLKLVILLKHLTVSLEPITAPSLLTHRRSSHEFSSMCNHGTDIEHDLHYRATSYTTSYHIVGVSLKLELDLLNKKLPLHWTSLS